MKIKHKSTCIHKNKPFDHDYCRGGIIPTDNQLLDSSITYCGIENMKRKKSLLKQRRKETMKTKIKFIIICKEWYDGSNYYHSFKIISTKTGETLHYSFKKNILIWGSNQMAHQSALEWLANNKKIPVKWRTNPKYLSYEMENNYPIYWVDTEVTRKKFL